MQIYFAKTKHFVETKRMMTKPLPTANLISQNRDGAFGFGGTAMAMLDVGKCRYLLPAQQKMQMFTAKTTAL